MKHQKIRILDMILVLLEDTYLHGYEILKELKDDYGQIRPSTFYRWLRKLESLGLINGQIFPSLRGPDRKVYSLTDRGRTKLVELMKESLKIIVKFYEQYKIFSAIQFEGLLTKFEFSKLSGRVLFACMSHIHGFDIGTIRYVSKRAEGKSLDIIGDASRIAGIDIKYRPLEGKISEIPVRDNTYCEMWVSGAPRKQELLDVMRECARVLKPDGILRLVVPFIFARSAQDEGISGFVQYAFINLFPEIGFVELEDLREIMNIYFSDIKVIESGIIIFVGKKKSM